MIIPVPRKDPPGPRRLVLALYDVPSFPSTQQVQMEDRLAAPVGRHGSSGTMFAAMLAAGLVSIWDDELGKLRVFKGGGLGIRHPGAGIEDDLVEEHALRVIVGAPAQEKVRRHADR